jgi:translation initiation factor 2B subunit (eIF-2B alpha/beta/delta family)
MPKEEFENWLDIDNNAEVVATMTVSLICKAVADDKYKLADECKNNCTNKEEEILETSPNNVQMQEALRILRRAVQHRATNCQRHYECEQFIQQLLNAIIQQAKLHQFLNNFLCFL